MSETTSGGVGFTGLLFLVFLVLKLCNVIDWSWWWVTSPIWIVVGIALLSGIIATIYYVAKSIFRKKINKEK